MSPQGEHLERFGPFVLLRPLGSGGMGTAHLASHPGTDRLLVVKRMHPALRGEPTLFKRFIHEAEVASHVFHANVASLVAMGTIDREPFLATEYVFGIQVSQIVDRVQREAVDPLPLPVALQIAVQLAAGINAVHEARHRETKERLGLVHRDVGARNVLVGFDGRVRLIDLGLGKSVLADWETAVEVLAGSPDYMPPEQALGHGVDARADVYAAAVVAWELLAGTKRIREDAVAARVRRALEAQPESLRDRRPDVPESLERLLMRAMAPEPEARISSAAELHAGLQTELNRWRKRGRAIVVRRWLDAACATVIARERRALRQLQRALPSLSVDESQVEMHVGKVWGWAPPVPEPEPELPPESPVAAARRWVAERLSDLGDPVTSGLSLTQVILVFTSFCVVVCAAAALTVWLLLPSRAPDVLPNAVERVAPAAVVDHAAPAPVVEAARSTRLVEETLAPAMPVSVDPAVDPAVGAKKRVLLLRLKGLRRVRYDVRWQRRLTGLSARLSRARTIRALTAIEAALARLERSTDDGLSASDEP